MDECYEILYRNKMSIHIEAGNIFFEIVNSGESILDFNAAQQNYDKKLLQIKFSYSKDYCSYVSEYLIMAIVSVIDINYGLLTNKNTKFFYSFNDRLDRKGFPVQYVRHTYVWTASIATKRLVLLYRKAF